MSINPYSKLVIPNVDDLISSFTPLLQEGTELSPTKTIQDGKIAEAVQKLDVFSKKCEKTFHSLDKQKQKKSQGNSEARQRIIAKLTTAVSQAKEFTGSIETKEPNLLEAIDNVSKLTLLIKEKSAVRVKAKKKAHRHKGKLIKNKGKEKTGKAERKSNPKLIKTSEMVKMIKVCKDLPPIEKANAFFELYIVNRQERIDHLDTSDLSLNKLEALKTSSLQFLELMAKVNYCVSKDHPLDSDAARMKCVAFLEDLLKNCSDEDLLERTSQVLEILSDDEQEMNKGLLQKVFQLTSSIYFDYKEELTSIVEKSKAKIEENKTNSILLRSVVDELPLLEILRELGKDGIEQNTSLFNFLDPKGTIRIALILDEDTSYSHKVMAIVDLLSSEAILREDCSWDDFGKFVAHWPLFLNIKGIPVGGLKLDPLQAKLERLTLLRDEHTRKSAVKELLVLSQELADTPEQSLHQFVCAYLLNFIDRQGTARVDYCFGEGVTGEATRYGLLAKELEMSNAFKELISEVKGKPIGEKYRTEQFKQAVELLLTQSVAKTEEYKLLMLSLRLKNPSPKELVQGLLDDFAIGKYDHVNSFAACFKRLFVEKYLKFNPQSFLSKKFKKEAARQEFIDLFNTVTSYIQYQVLTRKNNKERGDLLCGFLLATKAAAEQGAMNAAISMYAGAVALNIDERRFPEAWKIVNDNQDAQEALEWLNNMMMGSRLAKYLEMLSKEGKQLMVPSVTKSFGKMENLFETLGLAEGEKDKKQAKKNIGIFVNQKLFKDRDALSLWFNAWKSANSMNKLYEGFKQEFDNLSITFGKDIEEELESLSNRLRKPKKT